uniref:Putative DNA topoisomerase-primase n=1 Tax=viral metagenome TaxID=1070528 RepID=A0A6M3JKH0_9ZZZZ
MGNVPEEKKKAEKDYRKMLNDTWRMGQSLIKGDPVMEYLAGRGLKLIPDNVRFAQACWESETKTRMPAMIALVTGPDGKPVTIHRTYLKGGKKAPIESPRKLMPHNGTLHGAAIRLFEPEQGVLGIAEGAETAIAATQLFKVPTWAAVTAGIMESWEPPEGIETVFIFGDNDASYTGQKSAYTLANKLALKGLKIVVRIPEEIGDWNDD